jgi:hypothetical protein
MRSHCVACVNGGQGKFRFHMPAIPCGGEISGSRSGECEDCSVLVCDYMWVTGEGPVFSEDLSAVKTQAEATFEALVPMCLST